MKLFSQYVFKSSGKVSQNRIALAPMTNLQSNDDGTLGEDEYNFLVRRAREGFGLIFTCASHVTADGQGWKGELGIFDDKHLPGLTRLAQGIHECGSLGIVQIFHGGARSPEALTGKQPWSASAHTIMSGGKELKVREATSEDIEAVIESFVKAAERAYKAGFDGIELHGAHGYLLHQFLSTFTNKRTDMWGGSPENRFRLLLTILQKIRSSLPRTFMAGVRISPEDKHGFKGIDFDEALDLSSILCREGADFIHVSPWDAFKKPEKYPDGKETIVELYRERLPEEVPVIVAGEIWTPADAERALELGADIAALGKCAIGNPDWAVMAKDENYLPQKPPYTVTHLREAGLGEAFIGYMRRWKDFVLEDR
ncbi:MAG: tRNA-dihydrouridine synthase [Ignavibacteria bacterium]|nr:tRNA-dihydrouridine synthase [Ignavibacteria bacterium]